MLIWSIFGCIAVWQFIKAHLEWRQLRKATRSIRVARNIGRCLDPSLAFGLVYVPRLLWRCAASFFPKGHLQSFVLQAAVGLACIMGLNYLAKLAIGPLDPMPAQHATAQWDKALNNLVGLSK
jgi:hypothetical protein